MQCWPYKQVIQFCAFIAWNKTTVTMTNIHNGISSHYIITLF